MSAAKLPPGPWEACFTVVRTKPTEDLPGFFIADCYASSVPDQPEFSIFENHERYAIAFAISAIPELIDVAERVLMLATIEMPQILIDKAHEALQKAGRE